VASTVYRGEHCRFKIDCPWTCAKFFNADACEPRSEGSGSKSKQAFKRRSNCFPSNHLAVAAKALQLRSEFYLAMLAYSPTQPNGANWFTSHSSTGSGDTRDRDCHVGACAFQSSARHGFGCRTADRSLLFQHSARDTEAPHLRLVTVGNESLRKPFRASSNVREHFGYPSTSARFGCRHAAPGLEQVPPYPRR
jgi:hypothetical protein